MPRPLEARHQVLRPIAPTHFCISDAELLIPRHNKTIRPVMARDIKKRVLVTRTRIARHGGNLALADFHVTPPFGSSILVDGSERRSGY
jgi:hypothetical protein